VNRIPRFCREEAPIESKEAAVVLRGHDTGWQHPALFYDRVCEIVVANCSQEIVVEASRFRVVCPNLGRGVDHDVGDSVLDVVIVMQVSVDYGGYLVLQEQRV
jgi:hypothetical protein